MGLKHIKLFENYVESINEEYEKPGDFPGTPFKGSSKEEAEKQAGEKWNGYDENGYPNYVGESAKKLRTFLKDALENNKGVIIKVGEDKAILAAKYKNGLYYFIKNIDLPKEQPEEVVVKTIQKEIEKVKEEPKVEPKTIPQDIVKTKKIKMIPLTHYINPTRGKKKVHRDAAGKKVKSLRLVGNTGKQERYGYALEGGDMFFNDFEGNSWKYNPETGQKEKVDKEEAKLTKYKAPKDKKEFRKFLKKYDIK